MNLRDSIGSSEAKGVLVHQSDSLSIKFEKRYNNIVKAGQKGSFNVLIYEGSKHGLFFKGKWYYKGHEKEPSYSGTWEMI